MTASDFTTAARAEAERVRDDNSPLEYGTIRATFLDAFEAGAEWARDHLAAQDEAAIRALATATAHTGQDIVEAARIMRDVAQEPTDAEVLAALNAQGVVVSPKMHPAPSLGYWGDKPAEAMRAALSAARAARRDKEGKP